MVELRCGYVYELNHRFESGTFRPEHDVERSTRVAAQNPALVLKRRPRIDHA